MPYWGLYSASKAALVALSDALRLELASVGVGVTVLTLGALDTDIRRRGLDAWPDGLDAGARAANAALVAMIDGGAGPPDDVAVAVVDLLRAGAAPAHLPPRRGIDDLLALAAQPAEVRDAALDGLLHQAVNGAVNGAVEGAVEGATPVVSG